MSDIFKRYRILPLIVVGLFLLTLFDGLALLIWAFLSYIFTIDVSAVSFLPVLIYLLGILVSCLLMTLLINGGTVFPSLAVALIAAIVSLFFADVTRLTVGGILLRLILAALAGTIGFTVGKLHVIRQMRKKRRARPPRPAAPAAPPAAEQRMPLHERKNTVCHPEIRFEAHPQCSEEPSSDTAASEKSEKNGDTPRRQRVKPTPPPRPESDSDARPNSYSRTNRMSEPEEKK